MLSVTAVIPLYRVERYLPDLLASLDDQEPGDYSLDLLFVDDGSPDRSGEMVAEWLARTPLTGRLIRQENAGVSAARNTGLDAATGEWITFPDSDDLLQPGYFAAVARFLARHADEVDVASARLLRLREPDPTPTDVHALSFRFAGGDRVVRMDRHPDFFQLNVASAFFRLADLRRAGVRFRTGLHASEDALFVAEYFLGLPAGPRLGLVATAGYVYRRRATRDSAVDAFRTDPRAYYERFLDGYEPLLARAAADGGAPAWLQSMFLYECQWLLPVQLTDEGRADVLDDAQRQTVLRALAGCARFVDEDRLFGYDATALPLESRLLLQLLAGRDIPAWVGAYAQRRADDVLLETPVRVGTRVRPFDARGGELTPRSVDVVRPDYFGQDVLHVVRATLPAVPARVEAGGVPRPVIVARRGEGVVETTDRHRRRRAGSWALPSRAGDVRVWKPVVGPSAAPAARVRRVAVVGRMLAVRTLRRWRRGIR